MARRVILVNDSKFESLILKDLLTKLDYEVEITDEFRAISVVEDVIPHLVIVNYIMQQTTGDRLIKLIKAGMPEVICVLSSSNQISKDQFNTNEVDGILKTPVSMFTLKDLLQRLGEFDIKEPAVDRSICKHCGKDLSKFGNDVRFCPYCGGQN